MWAHFCLSMWMFECACVCVCGICTFLWGIYVQVPKDAQVCSVLLQRGDGSSPNCDNSLKAVTLSKGATPATEGCPFITCFNTAGRRTHTRMSTHKHVRTHTGAHRWTSRQVDRGWHEQMRKTCCACGLQVCLFVELTCCPEALRPQQRAVLKMTCIHPLNMRTIDWRIRCWLRHY